MLSSTAGRPSKQKHSIRPRHLLITALVSFISVAPSPRISRKSTPSMLCSASPDFLAPGSRIQFSILVVVRLGRAHFRTPLGDVRPGFRRCGRDSAPPYRSMSSNFSTLLFKIKLTSTPTESRVSSNASQEHDIYSELMPVSPNEARSFPQVGTKKSGKTNPRMSGARNSSMMCVGESGLPFLWEPTSFLRFFASLPLQKCKGHCRLPLLHPQSVGGCVQILHSHACHVICQFCPPCAFFFFYLRSQCSSTSRPFMRVGRRFFLEFGVHLQSLSITTFSYRKS